MFRFLCAFVSLVQITVGCGSNDSKDSNSTSSSYDFETSANARLLSSALSLRGTRSTRRLALGPANLCETGQTISCTGVSDMTGKLLTVGLLIQAGGQGLQSYMLTENFSDVTADSTSYNFDFKEPVTTSGALGCCGGSGDLSGGNSYFSNASFLFAYIDASFEIPYPNKNQVAAEMLGSHTVRFVLADQTSSGYKRGDLLLKDSDNTFKWMTSTGTLSSTRPDAPITMNSKVVDYVNPFEKGNTEIPVISTEIVSPDGGDEKVTTDEEQLKAADRTYSFDFDASTMIVFMLAPSELTIIQSKAEMLKRIHLQGLPHTNFTFGDAALSTLIVTAPGDETEE